METANASFVVSIPSVSIKTTPLRVKEDGGILIQRPSPVAISDNEDIYMAAAEDNHFASGRSNESPFIYVATLSTKWAETKDQVANVEEAWRVEEMNDLATILGKPIIKDTMIANMCHHGIGSTEYTRLLIKMEAEKELKNKIESSSRRSSTYRKRNHVSYAYNHRRQDGSTQITNHVGGHNVNNATEYKKKNGSDIRNTGLVKNKKEYVQPTSILQNNIVKIWPLEKETFTVMRNTVNKYNILDTLIDDNVKELNTLKDRMIVNKFLNVKLQPIMNDASSWSNDMIKYFMEKWEENRKKGLKENVEEMKDVIEKTSKAT
ncbi:hypothetical protein Tco_0879709 [Tanacetum coccineum]